jgi:hypothetical protein
MNDGQKGPKSCIADEHDKARGLEVGVRLRQGGILMLSVRHN